MSHRISKGRAKRLYEKELDNRGLQRKGIIVKSSRKEKRRLVRMKKGERFIEMLRRRGGLFKTKEEVEENNDGEKMDNN